MVGENRYYEGGVSSVYFWNLDDGFAGVILLKKGTCAPPGSGLFFLEIQTKTMTFSDKVWVQLRQGTRVRAAGILFMCSRPSIELVQPITNLRAPSYCISVLRTRRWERWISAGI